MPINEELVLCAQINFENLAKARPDVASDPFYRVAKAQLDEALGGQSVEKSLDKKCPPHQWDRSGERCTVCGDKDWMT